MGEPVCATILGRDDNSTYQNKLSNTALIPVTGDTSSTEATNLLNCLRGKLNYYSGSAAVPYEIMDVNQSIANKQASVQIAKDRAASLQNVNSKVSYYQSWFPLAKPLKQSSLPILIGLTLFMMVLLFGYLLAVVGVEIKLAFPYIESVFGIRSFSDLISKPVLLLIIVCILLGSLVAYFIYDKFFKKQQ
jgi:hypothetical protein